MPRSFAVEVGALVGSAVAVASAVEEGAAVGSGSGGFSEGIAVASAVATGAGCAVGDAAAPCDGFDVGALSELFEGWSGAAGSGAGGPRSAPTMRVTITPATNAIAAIVRSRPERPAEASS